MTKYPTIWAHPTLILVLTFPGFILSSLSPPTGAAQESIPLVNGSMEEETNGYPSDWIFPTSLLEKGFKYSLDSTNAFQGSQSALVDSTNSQGGRAFGMLNQTIDPKPFRGKRVRFRAAVRTSDRSDNGRAQLWLRVDRKSDGKQPRLGAFDNMGDRPIQSDEWKHYNIVADIDKDAQGLTVGMLVLEKTKAWLDDATFEIVDDSVELTARVMPDRSSMKNAPVQPFYNHWLWLAGIAIVLFVVSQTKNRSATKSAEDLINHDKTIRTNQWINPHLQRFALTFSTAYWLLYSLPEPFIPILSGISSRLTQIGIPLESLTSGLTQFSACYKSYSEQLVHWAANNLMGIEGKLILPAGSGDTTFSYIRLLVAFITAMAIALIWTGAMYRRKSDHPWIRDFLRSYLRYVLALTMLGYGLAKTGFIQTQFAQGGVPNEFQLARTYGASSPMGLLWTFMAASPMYTFFAGLGEVTGGVLLVFRRTTTLGALVVFGVMLNVVMLNFCYDVPVKQYSFHLLAMAVFLILPDIPRLANVLLFNRPTTERGSFAPYLNSKTIWPYLVVKSIVVFCLFVLPIYDQTKREIQHEHIPKAESEHLLINRGFRWINEYPYNR